MENENKKTSSPQAAEPEVEFADLPDYDDGSGGSHALTIAMVIIAVLLIIAYSIGAYYYNSHFLHNTVVNNTRLGEMTVEEAEREFTQDFSSHKIAVTEKERTEIIDPKSVNAVIDVGTQIQDLKDSQNPWLWFIRLFGENRQTIHLNVTYDEAALQKTVAAMECFKEENVQAPVDAYIKVGDSAFEIVPEVMGNTVKKEELIKRIGDAFATCVTKIDLETEDLYVLPQVYSRDKPINKALNKANSITHGSITYDFSYKQEVLDYNTTRDWVIITKDFKLGLDKDKMRKYVTGLCNTYNTMGSSRDFTTADGRQIHVYDGDYGWKIDAEKELKQLIKDIKTGTDINREPIYEYRAMCRNSERDDVGDSYVEVSLARQEVWLYIDGENILETSCVTGKPTEGRRTYPGIYSITYKQRDTKLVGEDYSSPVKYWMPFDGNRGLHDASWRHEFGGKIYKSNGSHGCVNLPEDAAATIFKYVDTGFPVVIYED